MHVLKAICPAEVEGVCVGHATDARALTGCTAVVFPRGAVAGHVVRGCATGSRELAAATPAHLVERIHAICFAGGSAFGLAAATGVMERLEEADIGYRTLRAVVPIVPAAVVYDLHVGDARVRPNTEMGRLAADAALAHEPAVSGNVGAGAGVSAGKILGASHATKTGFGQAALRADDGLAIAAFVVVNPVGDVLHPTTRAILAGTRETPTSPKFLGSRALACGGGGGNPFQMNTTLALVATNAALSRVEASWVADQASVALARQIDPPFTRNDGDIVFAASLGELRVDLHRVGLLCAEALAAALVDGCESAEPAGGLPCGQGLIQPR